MKRLKKILISLTFLSVTFGICTFIILIVFSIESGVPLFKTDEVKKPQLASTIPSYDEFLENYNELYPNGYDSSARWYKYQNITTTYSAGDSDKTITSSEFIGYINFDEDSFDGTVSSFKYTINETAFKDDQVLYYKTYEAYLKEGMFYSLEEIKDSSGEVITKTSKGCSGIKYFNLKTSFSNDFYSVDQYLNFVNENKYDLIRIYSDEDMGKVTDGYVTFNINKTFDDYEKQEKTFYYYDENYSVYEVTQYKYYINNYYSNNYNIVGSSDLKNVSSVSRLEYDNGVNITSIPTTYDEEYVYDESKDLIYL